MIFILLKIMITYIIDSKNKAIIFENGRGLEYNGREGVIHRLSNDYFISLKEYRKLIAKKLGVSRQHPIYLSDELMLFKVCTQNEVYYINYFAISFIGYENDTYFIIFSDGTYLYIDTNKRMIDAILKKITMIESYFENIKHNYAL